MLTDLSLSCKHSGTGPPREYTLTHTPHILFTPTIAFSSSHLAHASEQSKMVKLRRWPSIKSHARSIHASRWVVEDWTWTAVARYWSSNDVSPCFRESLVRNTICLVVVSTIYSQPDISLFSRSKGTGGKVASGKSVKSQNKVLVSDFLWVTGAICGLGPIHGGQPGQSMIQKPQRRWNNLHSYLNITLVILAERQGRS